MLLAGSVLLAALVAAAPAVGGQEPIVRSARVVGDHVVLELSVADLRPVELVVANRPTVNLAGALLPQNIRLRETIQLPAVQNGVARWQSARALPPGRDFVQVMAVETGGVTDCPRFLRNCLGHWSDVIRVLVGKSS